MYYLKQNIQNRFYTYRYGEFLPIYEGNTLLNRNAFYKYKARCAVKRTAQFLASRLQVTTH